MSKVSAVLRKIETGYLYWCPGCKRAHQVWVGNPSGPNWSFDGNVDRPTFAPSIRIYTPAWKDEDDGTQHPEETDCHHFVVGGAIQFCGDCQHDLKGQTVPLPPFPDDYAY